MVEKDTITDDSSQNELTFITRVDQTGQDTDRRTGGQTREAFAGQVSQRPEDITHERRAAGAGLSDGGEDLLDVNLQVLLQKQATRVLTQKQARGMTFGWKHWFNVGNVRRIQLKQHLPC